MLAEHLACSGPWVVLIAATFTLGMGTKAQRSRAITPAQSYLDSKHADRPCVEPDTLTLFLGALSLCRDTAS